MSLQTPDELRRNLAEYRSQQQQVEQLLLNEPDNQEYADIYNSLAEVISLTEDLLRDAAQAAPAAAAPEREAQGSAAPQSVITTPSLPQLPSILPPQVAAQIRSAQQKAALSGQAPPAWAIGARCEATWSGDGAFYSAVVKGVSAAGNFVVTFDEGGYDEEVAKENVRPPPEDAEIYTGVAAPKRKRVEDEPLVGDMPKWLEVKPTDDDKTRAKKKKLQKSYKSKMRFQKMDMETKDRQQSWLDFKKGKGAKKKAGFFTGRQKESMFSVPLVAGAKVGVVGSGKGVTDYQPPKRHNFAGTGAE